MQTRPGTSSAELEASSLPSVRRQEGFQKPRNAAVVFEEQTVITQLRNLKEAVARTVHDLRQTRAELDDAKRSLMASERRVQNLTDENRQLLQDNKSGQRGGRPTGPSIEVVALQNRVDSLEAAELRSAESLVAKDNELSAERARGDELARRNDELETEVAIAKKEAAEASVALTALQRDLTDSRAAVAAAHRDLSSARALANSAKGEAADARTALADALAKNRELQKSVSEAEDRIRSLGDAAGKLGILQQEIETLRAERSVVHRRIEEMEGQNDSLRSDFEKRRAQFIKDQEELISNNHKREEAAEKKLKTVEANYDKLKTTNRELERKREDLEALTRELRQKLEETQQLSASTTPEAILDDPEIRKMQRELEVSRITIAKLKNDVAEAQRDRDLARKEAERGTRSSSRTDAPTDRHVIQPTIQEADAARLKQLEAELARERANMNQLKLDLAAKVRDLGAFTETRKKLMDAENELKKQADLVKTLSDQIRSAETGARAPSTVDGLVAAIKRFADDTARLAVVEPVLMSSMKTKPEELPLNASPQAKAILPAIKSSIAEALERLADTNGRKDSSRSVDQLVGGLQNLRDFAFSKGQFIYVGRTLPNVVNRIADWFDGARLLEKNEIKWPTALPDGRYDFKRADCVTIAHEYIRRWDDWKYERDNLCRTSVLAEWEGVLNEFKVRLDSRK